MPRSPLALVRKEYDRLAAQYDRRWRYYTDATMQVVLDSLELDGTEWLLDVACGTGTLDQRLRADRPGLRIIGTDLSRGMLLQAIGKPGLDGVAWVQAAAARLPFRSAGFDVAICANGFHSFGRPEQALAELRRVLRPGGRLILVDWCDDYLACKLCSIWLRWTDPAFFRSYSLAECRSRVERGGFEIEAASRLKIDWLWGVMRLVGRNRR